MSEKNYNGNGLVDKLPGCKSGVEVFNIIFNEYIKRNLSQEERKRYR